MFEQLVLFGNELFDVIVDLFIVHVDFLFAIRSLRAEAGVVLPSAPRHRAVPTERPAADPTSSRGLRRAPAARARYRAPRCLPAECRRVVTAYPSPLYARR